MNADVYSFFDGGDASCVALNLATVNGTVRCLWAVQEMHISSCVHSSYRRDGDDPQRKHPGWHSPEMHRGETGPILWPRRGGVSLVA
jgi:hypothetical protein